LDKGNYVELCNFLSRDWELELISECCSVEEMWCHFRDTLLEGMRKFVPKTKNTIYQDSKKYFSHLTIHCKL
jgi:hypothetical protein